MSGASKIAAIVPVFVSMLAATLMTGCSNSRPEVSSAEDGKKDGAGSDEGSGSDDGDGLGNSGGTGTGDGSGSFSGCGFSGWTDTKTIFNSDLASTNIRFHGFAGAIFTTEYNIVVKGTVSFSGNLNAMTTSTDFDIISADPPNAQGKAEEEIGKVTGNRQATAPDPASWPDLFEDNNWEKVHCGVLPVTKVVEQSRAHATTVEYSPAVPWLLTPVMSKERFEQEFGDEVVIDGITANVISTTNPKISTGQKTSGSVAIKSVSPSATITDNSGGNVSIDADYAFRIDFSFGTFETTSALGLYKSATYYVKDGAYTAISIETGIKDAPVVHYFDQ